MKTSSYERPGPQAHLCVVMLAGWISMSPAVSRAHEPPRMGLVGQRPESGPLVETDQGYMVPYEERIAGTDIRFKMVPIPGGRFLMGSPDSDPGNQHAESPQVHVVIKPFWMGKHEVTWREFRIYMGLEEASRDLFRHQGRTNHEFGVDAVTAPSEIYDTSFAYEGGKGADTPAVTMTRFAAKQYTKWLSVLLEDFYRLPSEAEWEYACRAGTTTAYSFGEDASRLSDYAWFEANSGNQRHKVGSKRPNARGLHDMHGNAAEWVLDAFSPDGYTAYGDGDVSAEDAIRWPSELYPGVARGGSFELGAVDCRCAARLASSEDWSEEDPELPNSPWWHTSFEATGVGFRIVRPLAVPQTAAQKERYWQASNPEFQAIVRQRIEEGKGIGGVVHPDQPYVIHPPK